MSQSIPALRLAVSIALPGLLAISIGVGLFGCQGCQSSPGEDLGDPDQILENLEKRPENGVGRNGSEPERPPPKEEPKEKALIERIEFIENAERSIQGTLRWSRSDTKETFKKKVLDVTRKAFEQNSDNPIYMLVLARALFMNKMLKEAREMCESALAKDSKLYPAWVVIALSWLKEDEKRALQALQNLKNPDVPGPWGLILLAEFWADARQDDKAEKTLEEARKKFPGSIHPLFKLARFYGDREKWEQAFAMSQKVIDRDSKNPKAWLLKAKLHLLFRRSLRRDQPGVAKDFQDHTDLAKDALKTVCKLDPESDMGKAAKHLLERLEDPLKDFKEIALDSSVPFGTRERAIKRLYMEAREAGIDFWAELSRDADQLIRLRAVTGLAFHGGKEALDILKDVIGNEKKECLDRNQAVSSMREVFRAERSLADRHLDLAVEALLKGLRICMRKFEADPDENLLFQEIRGFLAKLTRKHFGEGRGHETLKEMEETASEWDEWWKQEKGK